MWLAFFDVAFAEKIAQFDTVIDLSADGSFVITETITYDFEEAERRGIYRTVSDRHAQAASAWYKSRYIDISLDSVTHNGVSATYLLESDNGLNVRIGDEDVTITGEHQYVIRYTVDGAIPTYDGVPELYWNVTGSEWQVPIDEVTVTVRANDPLLLLTADCYVGVSGTNVRCRESTVESEYSSRFSATNIQPGEQFTIAQSLNLPQDTTVLERFNELLLWFGVVGVWLGILAVSLMRWITHYKLDEPIIAQYEPFEDFKPMFTGVLFDKRLDPRDVSAGIVYLAEQGFLTIRKTTDKVLGLFNIDDYELTLKRPITETETAFQGQLLKLLFEEDDTPGTLTRLSGLRNNHRKLLANAKLLQSLQIAVVNDLMERDFIESNWGMLKQALISFVGFFIVAQGLFWWWSGAFASVVPFIILFAISAGVFLEASTRRTEKGYRAKNYLMGFKEFLAVTDKERFNFHNAPERNAETFMAYLPYAIAFGVEKKWTTVFTDIQINSPDWYSGPSNAAAFNAAVFTSELGTFTGALSTSSGSSGSSGGGSSGGGSGGGGGGSW